jgi:hypothetical protein
MFTSFRPILCFLVSLAAIGGCASERVREPAPATTAPSASAAVAAAPQTRPAETFLTLDQIEPYVELAKLVPAVAAPDSSVR